MTASLAAPGNEMDVSRGQFLQETNPAKNEPSKCLILKVRLSWELSIFGRTTMTEFLATPGYENGREPCICSQERNSMAVPANRKDGNIWAKPGFCGSNPIPNNTRGMSYLQFISGRTTMTEFLATPGNENGREPCICSCKNENSMAVPANRKDGNMGRFLRIKPNSEQHAWNELFAIYFRKNPASGLILKVRLPWHSVFSEEPRPGKLHGPRGSAGAAPRPQT